MPTYAPADRVLVRTTAGEVPGEVVAAHAHPELGTFAYGVRPDGQPLTLLVLPSSIRPLPAAEGADTPHVVLEGRA